MRSSLGLPFLLGATVLLLAVVGGAFVLFLIPASQGIEPVLTPSGPRESTAAVTEELAELPVAPSPAPEQATADTSDATAPTRVEVAEGTIERYGDWTAQSVSGRVEFPQGAPADDELWVLALGEALSPRSLYRTGKLLTEAGRRSSSRVLSAARVASDGSFVIEFPSDKSTGWLAIYGRYLYSAESQEIALPANEPVVVQPTLGALVTGQVVLPVGIKDAEKITDDLDVSLRPGTSGLSLGTDRAWLFRRTAKMNADGSFEFRAVSTQKPHDLRVESEVLADYAEDGIRLDPGEERHISVQLPRGARILGRVVDDVGVPIPNARVTASGEGFMGLAGEESAATESALDGSFELVGVPPGTTLIGAELEAWLETPAVSIAVTDEELLEGVELVLNRGGFIAGTARFETGEVVASTRIDVSFDPAAMVGLGAFNAMRGASGDGVTDAEGRFRITGLGKGPFVVEIEAEEEGGDIQWSCREAGVQPNTADLELILSPRPAFSGHVVDGDSTPIPVFQVHAEEVSKSVFIPRLPRTEPFEDPLGEFTMHKLTRAKWRFHVSAEGYGNSETLAVALPLPAGTQPAEFVLKPAGSITGYVIDSLGTPIAGAEVMLRVANAIGGAAAARHDAPKATANEEGSFQLGNLTGGSHSVVARHADYAESEFVPIDIVAGEITTDVVLTLRTGGVITGEVFNAEGKPAGGAQLIIQDTSIWETIMESTAADGTFRIERLRPGNWQITAIIGSLPQDDTASDGPDVSAIMESMRSTVAEVRDGEEVHVVLGAPPEDPVRVSGRVTHAGEPAADCMVVFLPEGEGGQQSMKIASLDEDGAYEVELAKPGPYLVQVQRQSSARGFEQTSLEFPSTIPKGEAYRLDLTLPVGVISGRVRTGNLDDMKGIRVTLATDGGVTFGTFMGGHYAETVTDADGSYHFDFLRPGTYSVSAGGSVFGGAFGGQADYGRVIHGGLSVDEGQHKGDVDFQLNKAGVVTGTVRDEAGKPLASAAIFVRDGEGHLLDRFSMVQSGPDGRFRYDGVAPGRYTLHARTTDLVTRQEVEFDVSEGDTVDTSLTLSAGTMLLVRIEDKSGRKVTTRISVIDSRGRELNGMISLAQIMGTGGRFSSTEQRIGPIPADRYTVRAVTDDGRSAEKPVTLTGQPERKLKLRLR